jgi:phosphomannomutase
VLCCCSGKTHFIETEVSFPQQQHNTIKHTLTHQHKNNLTPLFNKKIETLNQVDGLKILFTDTDWVLARLSGTEPLCRIYAESRSKKTAKQLIQITQSILFSTSTH